MRVLEFRSSESMKIQVSAGAEHGIVIHRTSQAFCWQGKRTREHLSLEECKKLRVGDAIEFPSDTPNRCFCVVANKEEPAAPLEATGNGIYGTRQKDKNLQ